MANYKSTLGGACSALGKTLMGVGIVPQLAGTPSKFLTYIAVAGFAFDAVGGFFGHLFAADAKQVDSLKEQVNNNTAAVSELRGNTPLPFKPGP